MKYSLGRHLPSTVNLVALITVARTGHVTRAAEELFLTQSAVSRQIKDLEDFVGKKLFTRAHGELSLTQEGRAYAEEVSELLDKLEHATLTLSTSKANSAHLKISSQITFASKWLFPRLADFSKQFPDIMIDVETHIGQPDPRKLQNDILILFRDAEEPGWGCDPLIAGGGYPVCSPALLASCGKQGVEALLSLPLLHQLTRPESWASYFRSVGVEQAKVKPGPTYSLLTMGLQAALADMGVAILPDFLVQEDLNAGRLVRVHDVPLVKRGSYMLMIREPVRKAPAVAAFRQWLLEQSRQPSG